MAAIATTPPAAPYSKRLPLLPGDDLPVVPGNFPAVPLTVAELADKAEVVGVEPAVDVVDVRGLVVA